MSSSATDGSTARQRLVEASAPSASSGRTVITQGATSASASSSSRAAAEAQRVSVWELEHDGKLKKLRQGDSDLVSSMTWKQRALRYPKRAIGAVVSYMLPHGYPDTVAASYQSYALWTSLGMMFSSASGVLSTQALLTAVGVGSGAVPLAAALNWVIKDGLGQLGGVTAAALIHNRFDADPKRWRFASAVAQDASTLLEITTPLWPAMFLPIAAIANVGKNVSWLSASASRAGLHQSLAIRGNLADVTAKAGSQTIAASTAGMALGVVLSPLIGSGTQQVLVAFAVMSLLHWSCIFTGLRRIVLPTVNEQRLELAVKDTLLRTQGGEAAPGASVAAPLPARVLRPDEVSRVERFAPLLHGVRERLAPVFAWLRGLRHGSKRGGAGYLPFTSASSEGAAGGAFSSSSSLPSGAPAGALRFKPQHGRVYVGPRLDDTRNFAAFYAASQAASTKYVVCITRDKPRFRSWVGLTLRAKSLFKRYPEGLWPARVQVLFLADAAWRDVISGFLHALYVAHHLDAADAAVAADSAAYTVAGPGSSGSASRGGRTGGAAEAGATLLVSSGSGSDAASSASASWSPALRSLRYLASDTELVSRGLVFTAEHGDRLLNDLEAAGWWVGQPVLEREVQRRLTLSGPPVAAGSSGSGEAGATTSSSAPAAPFLTV